MSDVIRKAVELADANFPWYHYRTRTDDYKLNQIELDALAAQLVRQVDALPSSNPDYIRRTILGIWADSVSLIEFKDGTYEETATEFDNNDRAMNTTKVIVDSGVLIPEPPVKE